MADEDTLTRQRARRAMSCASPRHASGPGLSPHLGLGLWNSVPGTLAVEFLLYAIGIVVYLKSTITRDRVGSIGLWMLLLFLAIVELATVLGPLPPSVLAVAWSAQAMWLLMVWPIGSIATATRPPEARERSRSAKASPSRNPPEAIIQGLSSSVEARRSLYSKLATAHALLSIFI
jgi:hypothetical protein